MKRNKLFVAIIVLVFGFILLRPWPTQAQTTCTSLGSPIPWDDATGWDCGGSPGVPTSNDTVIINNPHFKLVRTDAAAATITINGTLAMGGNAAVKTLTVGGNVLVGPTGLFQGDNNISVAQTHVVNIGGDITNNGTFDARPTAMTSVAFDVFLNGSGAQTIGGSNAIQFNNLTVNDTAVVAIPAGGTQPTVEGTLTNNGTLSQTQTVNNANVAFLEITNFGGGTNKYRGVEVNSTANLGDVTAVVEVVNFSGGEFCTTDGMGSPIYADRCYDVTATNMGTAVIRLWALSSELNMIPEANLAVYHNTGGTTWVELTTSQGFGNDGGSYSYGEGEASNFSPFLLADNAVGPTAVALQEFQATNSSGSGAFVIVAIILMLIIFSGGMWVFRKR